LAFRFLVFAEQLLLRFDPSLDQYPEPSIGTVISLLLEIKQISLDPVHMGEHVPVYATAQINALLGHYLISFASLIPKRPRFY
jgi:hypothetical protein